MKGHKCCTETTRNVGILALRIALGLVFIVHGWAKLNGIEATAGFLEATALPGSGVFWAWVAGLIEFIGGLAVLLGVYASVAAKVLALEMIVALLVVHLNTPWAQAELAILALGGSLAIAGVGAGKWKLTKKDCCC